MQTRYGKIISCALFWFNHLVSKTAAYVMLIIAIYYANGAYMQESLLRFTSFDKLAEKVSYWGRNHGREDDQSSAVAEEIGPVFS